MQYCSQRFFQIVVLALLFVIGGARASDDAVGVYAAFQESVFQVRIIELASGSQASLGTGFIIADGTLLATNYHVVSSKIFEPEKYRIEIEKDDTSWVLDVVAVDAVHDLALLAIAEDPDADETESIDTVELAGLFGRPFILDSGLPEKGETLYSLGNPHDIGMTVVEGNFNGLVEHRFVEQIHFSGAINPGMSGGPVVNKNSQVVGVNVATSGNQIGFLVPGSALSALLVNHQEAPSGKPLLQSIADQIASHTSSMVAAALDTEWERAQLGGVMISSSPLPWLECWGNSDKDKKAQTFTVSRGCHSGQALYLSHGFSSGYFEYEYMFFEAKSWPSFSVYQYLAQETGHAVPGNRGPTEQLASYRCLDREVENAQGLRSRVSYCVRPYKKLKGLNDVFYMAVSVDRDHESVMAHYTLSGVTQASAQQFLAHFSEVLAWPSL